MSPRQEFHCCLRPVQAEDLGQRGPDVRPNFDWELEERRAKTRAAAITDDGWVAGYSVKAAKTNAPINVATPTVITARKNLAIPAPTSAPKS